MTKRDNIFAKNMEFLEQEWDSISSEDLEEADSDINWIVHLIPKGSVLVSNKGNIDAKSIPIHQHDSDELFMFFESLENANILTKRQAAGSLKVVTRIKQDEVLVSEEIRKRRRKFETLKILPFGKKTDSVVIMKHLLK
jgi:hypothetical protein